MQAIYIFSGETALRHSLTKVLQSPFKKCNQPELPWRSDPWSENYGPICCRDAVKNTKKQQGASACAGTLPLGGAMAEGSNKGPETKTLVPTRQK